MAFHLNSTWSHEYRSDFPLAFLWRTATRRRPSCICSGDIATLTQYPLLIQSHRHSSVDSDSGKQLLSTPVQGPIVADDGTVVTLTPLAMPPPPPPPKMAEHPLDAARRPSMIEDEVSLHILPSAIYLQALAKDRKTISCHPAY